MIELCVFCGREVERRTHLRTPWSAGGHTYATDGHVCIRVERRPDVPERDDAPNVASFFADPPPDSLQALPRLELPTPKSTRCDECEVRGYQHDCPECTCECEHCNGGSVTQRVVVKFAG